MAQKMSSETYEEELRKVEEELQLLQIELADTIQINDQFLAKIDEKELELSKKEDLLKTLKEKDAAELQQLDLELTAKKERQVHELEFETNNKKKLSLQRDRYCMMVQENLRLTEAIRVIDEEISRSRAEHANAVHIMNKEMRQLRQIMEDKFRKELMSMDLSYQKEAFAALLESQKKAMFENAKLKDEVALQGVGIANLGARLTKQRIEYDACLEELKALYRKSRRLRGKLGKLSLIKNNIEVSLRNCEKEKALVEKEKHLILDHTSMNDSELISFQLERDELIEKLSRERATVELWHSRCRKVKEIFADIKPVTNSEKSGHYNKLAFIMFTLPSSTIYDNEAENNSRSYNTNGGSSNIKLTDFYDIVAHDDVLKRVFTPLDGKEPYLLTQYPAETITSDDKVLHFETRQDQNMIAWIVQQVIKLWLFPNQGMNVAESAAKKNECIHSNDKKFELDLDLIENGEMSEEQIQTLWDTTFTTNSDASVQGLPSAWIKRPLSQDKVPHLNYSILPATNPPSPIRIAGSGYNSRVERNDKKNKSLHEIGPPVVLPNIEQKSYGQHNTDFRSFPHSLKSFYSTETKKLSKSGQVLDKSRDPLITRKKAIQKTDIDQVNQLMNRIASSTAVKASTARQLVRNIQKSYSTTAMTKTNV